MLRSATVEVPNLLHTVCCVQLRQNWTSIMITKIILSRLRSAGFPRIIKIMWSCSTVESGQKKIGSGNRHNVDFLNHCSYFEQSLIWDCDTTIPMNQLKEEKNNHRPHCSYYCHHQVHWRTSDSLSLDDPRLPKLWLEHSLLVNPCGKKTGKCFLYFNNPKTRHQWQSPDIDQY